MDWKTESVKDSQLLGRLDLGPLGTDGLDSQADLIALVETHNARAARAADRIRQLVGDRERLADPDRWLAEDSADLFSERSRLRRETWDTLLGLRRIFEQREAILAQMEDLLRDRYCRLADAHDRAVAAAEKRLAKERRALEKANPYNAGGRFAALVADKETVADAAQRVAGARKTFESVASARRRIAADLRQVTARQREVFATLVN